jgi:hypothetical protein
MIHKTIQICIRRLAINVIVTIYGPYALGGGGKQGQFGYRASYSRQNEEARQIAVEFKRLAFRQRKPLHYADGAADSDVASAMPSVSRSRQEE